MSESLVLKAGIWMLTWVSFLKIIKLILLGIRTEFLIIFWNGSKHNFSTFYKSFCTFIYSQRSVGNIDDYIVRVSINSENMEDTYVLQDQIFIQDLIFICLCILGALPENMSVHYVSTMPKKASKWYQVPCGWSFNCVHAGKWSLILLKISQYP